MQRLHKVVGNSTLDRIFIFVGILFCVCLAIHRSSVWFETSGGDSAFLAETVSNIYSKGTADSIAAQSALKVVYGGYLTANADELERLGTGSVDESKSVLKAHAYWFLYLVSYLQAFFDVPLLLSILISLSFMGGLVVCYYLIRKEGGSSFLAALFCALLACHPFWREPLLHGQDYVDRYFIGIGGLLLLTLYRLSNSSGLISWAAVVTCFMLSCSLSERMALISGAIVGARSALFLWHRQIRTAVPLMVMAALGMAYGFIQIRFVLENHSYSAFLSLESFLHPIFVVDANARAKTTLFLAINAPLLLLALRTPFWGGVAILMMIPNVFGNIGGAEKIGWSTHYHSTYIPTLMFAAAFGISHMRRAFQVVGCGLMAIAFLTVDPYQTDPMKLSAVLVPTRFMPFLPWRVWENFSGGYYAAISQHQRRFEDVVPKGSVVTTPEFGMGRLIFGRSVYFFPIGLDKADVVLLMSCPQKPPTYCGYTSFLGDREEKSAIDELLLEKMQILGFDVNHPQEIVQGIYAFKKIASLPGETS